MDQEQQKQLMYLVNLLVELNVVDRAFWYAIDAWYYSREYNDLFEKEAYEKARDNSRFRRYFVQQQS